VCAVAEVGGSGGECEDEGGEENEGGACDSAAYESLGSEEERPKAKSRKAEKRQSATSLFRLRSHSLLFFFFFFVLAGVARKEIFRDIERMTVCHP